MVFPHRVYVLVTVVVCCVVLPPVFVAVVWWFARGSPYHIDLYVFSLCHNASAKGYTVRPLGVCTTVESRMSMPNGPAWNIELVSDNLANLLQKIVPEEPEKEYQQAQWKNLANTTSDSEEQSKNE